MNNASAALDLVIESYWEDAKTGKIKMGKILKARIVIKHREHRKTKKYYLQNIIVHNENF